MRVVEVVRELVGVDADVADFAIPVDVLSSLGIDVERWSVNVEVYAQGRFVEVVDVRVVGKVWATSLHMCFWPDGAFCALKDPDFVCPYVPADVFFEQAATLKIVVDEVLRRCSS